MKRLRYKLGDILHIPLSNGRSAYGRIYRDSTIAVFFDIQRGDWAKMISEPPNLVAGVFTTDLATSGWSVCGSLPFDSVDQSWPPPTFNRDIISGAPRIYHLGTFRPASEVEISGLFRQLMHKPSQLVNEIERLLAATMSNNELSNNEPHSK